VQVILDKGEKQRTFSLLKELLVPGPGVQLIQEESRAYYQSAGPFAEMLIKNGMSTLGKLKRKITIPL
jgi:hypothetical protein